MDDISPAWAPQRAGLGAISRIAPVQRPQRGEPTDAARVTDLREQIWRRPAADRIPAGDVLQFETLVFGGPVQASTAWPTAGAAAARPGAQALADEAAALAHPADRIHHTLRQLSRLHGL